MKRETWNTGPAVIIRISREDFAHLAAEATALASHRGVTQFADRFHDQSRSDFVPPAELEQWRYAYWYDDYTSLILARSFLAAIGEPFLVTSDEYTEVAETAHGLIHHVHGADWVIFTDYASPAWTRHTKKEQER